MNFSVQVKKKLTLVSSFCLGLLTFITTHTLINQGLMAFAQDGSGSTSQGPGLMGMIFGLISYCFWSYCTMVILQKIGQPNPWFAWIPILNLYAIFLAGDKPGWWTILVLIPLINLIGIILLIMAWVNIVKKLGKSPWLLLLLIVPLVNVLLFGYLAFG